MLSNITTENPPALQPDPELALQLAAGKHLPAAQHFIAQIFNQAYSARVSHFLPFLLTLQQNHRLQAALGLSPAAHQPLFLEQYLNKPIENILAGRLARPIDRARIMEVGNLASRGAGSARLLFIMLNAWLAETGYEWCVFTATAQVRHMFRRLGITLTPLANAHASRLESGQQEWGSYYQQQPQVVVGDIRRGAAIMRRHLERQGLPQTGELWRQARQLGQQHRLSIHPWQLSTCTHQREA